MAQNFPSIEALEANHRFPTRYCIKVIGQANDGFLARVVERARLCLTHDTSPQYTFRQTQNGKHLAVTLEIPASDPQQILDVYQGLAIEPGVVLLL
jgi:putative lipoic acid-binding regulatory protein